MGVRIDPATGERIEEAVGVQIDPATGERVSASVPHGASGSWEQRPEAPPLKDAMLPAYTAASKDPSAGLGRKALGIGSDVLSGILRLPAAAGRVADTHMGTSGDHPQSYRESLDQINRGKGPDEKANLITGMTKDPATPATILAAPIVAPLMGLGGAAAGLGGVAARVGAAGLGGAAEGAISATAHQADQAARTGQTNLGDAAKEVGLNAALPAASGLLGEGAKLAAKGVGGLLKMHGEKIATNRIKPNLKDMKDGFRIANVYKHGLEGSLEQTKEKLATKFDALTRQLSEKIQGSPEKIDMLDMLDDATKSIGGNKADSFGKNSQMEKATEFMLNEINEIAPDGVVDMATAQKLKRGLGKMGAWEWGKTDPESSAREALANAVYARLKKEIETKAPEGVREINQQLSELIPIERAVTRRIPIEARNSGLSLTDVIAGSSGAMGGMLAGGGVGGLAAAAGSLAANKIRRSPAVAAKAFRLGEGLRKLQPPSLPISGGLLRRGVGTTNFSERDGQ